MARKQPARAARAAPAVEFERSFPARPAAADAVLREVLQSLRQSRCPCGDLDEVRLALREALNNALKHGSQLDPEKKVQVRWRCDTRDGFSITVRDEGGGFDPMEVPDPTLPENLERFSGRGLYMIQGLMDHVEFRDHGREIHMRRRPRRR
ncbi:MAG: ATP-binding protein [Acidobacteria bacterium]|nr:ATP-binding protein [Acidobacteriota bacterium]